MTNARKEKVRARLLELFPTPKERVELETGIRMGERIAVPKGRCWIALNTSGFSIKPKAPPPILTRNSRTIDKLLYDT